jgi:hypothetical protein
MLINLERLTRSFLITCYHMLSHLATVDNYYNTYMIQCQYAHDPGPIARVYA